MFQVVVQAVVFVFFSDFGCFSNKCALFVLFLWILFGHITSYNAHAILITMWRYISRVVTSSMFQSFCRAGWCELSMRLLPMRLNILRAAWFQAVERWCNLLFIRWLFIAVGARAYFEWSYCWKHSIVNKLQSYCFDRYFLFAERTNRQTGGGFAKSADPAVDEYFRYVARTGRPTFAWSLIRSAFCGNSR